MARRKGAALFEVIHSDKRFPQRHGWSFTPPRWLSFGRSRGNGDVDGGMMSMESSSSPSRNVWSWLPSFNRFGMRMDSDRQLVSFELSYTTALVSAFGLVIVLALAYVIGKHSAVRPLPALAETTTDELRDGPIQADVLEVGPEVAMAAAPSPTGKATPRSATPAPQTARPTVLNAPKPPTTSYETNGKRTVGLHYVIVQSYPPEERQLADDAMKLLNQNGVPCSVETGLSFAPRWFSVVGYNGYVSVRSSADYDEYVARIEQIGEKFGSGVKFKKFKPMAFKWREPAKAEAKN